jgi:hypothetical protein
LEQHIAQTSTTILEKQCNHCGQTKPETEFRRNPRRPSGRHGTCKTCEKQRDQQRKENKEKLGLDSDQKSDLWLCESDPTRMYSGLFQRICVAGTLFDGNWPQGSVWVGAPEYRGQPSRWVVEGNEMREVDGPRRLIAVEYRLIAFFREVETGGENGSSQDSQ